MTEEQRSNGALWGIEEFKRVGIPKSVKGSGARSQAWLRADNRRRNAERAVQELMGRLAGINENMARRIEVRDKKWGEFDKARKAAALKETAAVLKKKRAYQKVAEELSVLEGEKAKIEKEIAGKKIEMRLEEEVMVFEDYVDRASPNSISYFEKLSRIMKLYEEVLERRSDANRIGSILKYYLYEDGWWRKNIAGRDLIKLYDIRRSVVDCLARGGDFDSFLLAREYNIPYDRQFYAPRRSVLIKLGIIQDCQDLVDGKITKLVIKAPPGIGKSVVGTSLMQFISGLDPRKRSLLGSHSAGIVNGFYKEFIRFFTDKTYRHNEIFKNVKKTFTDSDLNALYFNEQGREPNILCRSIEVGATGIIHINGLLYMDDIIKGAEQANNKDTVQKLVYNFTSTFLDRCEHDRVPLLVIGTPWCPTDLIAVLEQTYGGSPLFRVNSTPCYTVDENGKKITSFPYEGGAYKSVEYWDEQIRLDDPIIASAKFFMKPMERDGRPLAEIQFFTNRDLLDMGKPDFICAAGDVAIGGGDAFSMPIAFVYERDKSAYIVDVMYTRKDTDYSIPKAVEKILLNKVEMAHFEEKEGNTQDVINYGISSTIQQMLRKRGFRCRISSKSAAGQKSKLNRILDVRPNILGRRVFDNDYAVFFRTPSERSAEYNEFVTDLQRWSDKPEVQGKKSNPDDAPDSVSLLLRNCLGANSTKAYSFSRKLLGL